MRQWPTNLCTSPIMKNKLPYLNSKIIGSKVWTLLVGINHSINGKVPKDFNLANETLDTSIVLVQFSLFYKRLEVFVFVVIYPYNYKSKVLMHIN